MCLPAFPLHREMYALTNLYTCRTYEANIYKTYSSNVCVKNIKTIHETYTYMYMEEYDPYLLQRVPPFTVLSKDKGCLRYQLRPQDSQPYRAHFWKGVLYNSTHCTIDKNGRCHFPLLPVSFASLPAQLPVTVTFTFRIVGLLEESIIPHHSRLTSICYSCIFNRYNYI